MNTTCPGCDAPLRPGDARCRACGLLLVGPAAAELGRVDAELRRLDGRRRVLLDVLRSASGPGPAPAVPTPTPGIALPTDRRTPWSPQQVLLGLGVALLVVAGLVFVAVAWETLGVTGQVAVVAGAALAATGVSRFLETRRLGASAEAVAVLAVGLLGTGLVAARTLGLADLDELDPYAYAAGASTLVLALCALAGLRSATRAWGALAVVAVLAAVASGLRAADPGWFAYALVLPLAGAVLLGLSRVPARWARFRGPARAGSAALVVAGWCVAPLAALDDATAAVASAGVGLLTAAAVLVLSSRTGGAARLWAAHPTRAGVTVGAAGLQLWAAASLAPAGVRAGLVVVAAAVVLAALRRTPDLRTRWSGAAAAVAAATLPLVTLDLLVRLRTAERPGWADLAPLVRDATWVAALVALAAWVGLALLAGRVRPGRRALTGGVTGFSALALAGLAAGTTTPAPLVVALAAVATTLAVRAARSPGPVEVALLAAVVAGELAAFGVALLAVPDRVTPAAAVLAGAGVVALAYGFRPGRSFLWWVGSGAVSAGTWLWLGDRGVETAEAFTLPLAALCLLAGALGRLRRPDLSSWAVVGPALTAGLVPSAVLSVDDEGLVRPLVLLGVAAVLLLVGVARRWQALVVVPALALAIVTVSQLAPYAVGLPRWVGLGTAGALLLVVGVRYEARRRDAVAAAHWLRGLH